MTCARRPAGAHKPVLSPSAGSRRPEPRSRRACVRFALAPALALLLGVFAPAPAQAQADPADATLSGLTASTSDSAAGTFAALALTPAFAAATTSYTASAANSATHLKLTPTAANSAAKVTVGRQTDTLLTQVASGTASDPIALRVGANPVTVKVTATDGTTTRTYTVTVTRQPALPGALVNFKLTPGVVKLDASWNAPPQDNAVTGYDVHYTSAAASSVTDAAAASGSDPSAAWVDAGHSGTGARITLSSLTTAVWRVRARAVNSTGNGAWSIASARPQTTVKFKDASLTVDEDVGDVEITLIPGHANTFTGALRYSRTEQLDEPPATYTFTSTSTPDAGLDFDITVDEDDKNKADAVITISLVPNDNLVPVSPSSMTLTIRDDDLPGAPVNFRAQGGTNQFSVTWNKRPGEGPVTAFQFRYRRQTAPDRVATKDGDPSTGWVAVDDSGGTPVNVQGLLTWSQTVMGLGHSESYYLQVRATDGSMSNGFPVYGPWSDRSSVTTADPSPATGSANPQPPGNLSARSDSDGGLTLSWAAPPTGARCVDIRYKKEGGSWSAPVNVCKLTWTGSSLSPGDYTAQVRSTYSGGITSAWSEAVSVIVKGGVIVSFDFTADSTGTIPPYNRVRNQAPYCANAYCFTETQSSSSNPSKVTVKLSKALTAATTVTLAAVPNSCDRLPCNRLYQNLPHTPSTYRPTRPAWPCRSSRRTGTWPARTLSLTTCLSTHTGRAASTSAWRKPPAPPTASTPAPGQRCTSAMMTWPPFRSVLPTIESLKESQQPYRWLSTRTSISRSPWTSPPARTVPAET